MQKTRFIQNATIIALGVAIIIMSVGYAAYQSQLTVTGSATVEQANWDVHFDTDKANYKETLSSGVTAYEENSGVTLTQVSKNQVTFAVKMAIGDSYEVEIPVINDGTFNAQLDTVTLEGTEDKAPLSITGTSYTGDVIRYAATMEGSAVAATAENTNIDKKSTKTLKVKIDAVDPQDETKVAAHTGIEYTFTLTLNYGQRA